MCVFLVLMDLCVTVNRLCLLKEALLRASPDYVLEALPLSLTFRGY